MSIRLARPIDPLRPTAAGRYSDDLVTVTRADEFPPGLRTEHFAVTEADGRLHVTHAIPADRIDDDLAGLLAAELFTPGWVAGASTFERVFTGIVLSSGPDPVSSWELFYRNTLRRLAAEPSGTGSIAGYAPVYARAMSLIGPGTTLDVGTCFGFLPLMLAADRPGDEVIGSDVSAGAVALLAGVSQRLGTPVRTLAADATRVPLPDAAVDTVTALHLLEHLEPADGDAAIAEALRLARRRVVIAVPFEDEPNAAFGHVRTFDPAELRRVGRAAGTGWTVEEHHGGWLILDH